MRTARIGLGRGVYVAPWVGPEGEVVLLAITRDGKLAGDPLIIQHGGNHVEAGDRMWDRLEEGDPIPILRIV
jgi:hypothetical protein